MTKESQINGSTMTATITACLADCSAHEKFSIMLQERLDNELSELHRTVACLTQETASLRECVRAMSVAQKQVLLRMTLRYYMETFPNIMGTSAHYLNSMANDLYAFLKHRHPSALVAAVASDAASIAELIAAPFVSSRRAMLYPRNAAQGRHDEEEDLDSAAMERTLLDIARLYDACPADVLMEFACEVSDMPDLLNDA